MTIVVKLGSSLVAGPKGTVRRTVVARRAREIASVVDRGEAVAVVSSGAIALGLPHLGLDRRPRAVPKLQAASALGQTRLQRAWESALARHGLHAGQVLLRSGDTDAGRAMLDSPSTKRQGKQPMVQRSFTSRSMSPPTHSAWMMP